MKSIFSLLLLLIAPWLHAAQIVVYFGTGGGEAKGIYHATLNTEKGKLSAATLVAEVKAPGFLAFHPDRTKLYAIASIEGTPSVVAYQIGEKGLLTLLSSEVIPDGGGAHIRVHPTGHFLLTAQYGGGSVALFPLATDGTLKPCQQIVEHSGGSGVVAKRQEAPHPHYVGFSPDGRFAFVPDLGLDQVVVYQIQFDPVSIKQVGAIDAIPGGGPRHMKFSRDGQFIFLLNELSLSVSTFAYNSETAEATLRSTKPTLSDAVKAAESFNSASEILVHPNGQFVYAANRGHDSVTAFRINPETGHLDIVDVEPIRGAWPRNINIDASGRWLLAAGAHSNTVAVFEIDPATGQLTYQRNSVINVPNPICVLLND